MKIAIVKFIKDLFTYFFEKRNKKCKIRKNNCNRLMLVIK